MNRVKFTWSNLMIIAFIFFNFSLSAQSDDLPELEVVDFVEIEHYLGKWFQVAAIPQRFQKGCQKSKAEYSKINKNRIRVINTCEVNGKKKIVKGEARVVDSETNAKLKVQFFKPFEGDYWIIELGKEYEYAVVGDPSRSYLWILSRTSKISDELYESLLGKIETIHLYDPSKIIRSPNSIINFDISD